MLATLVADLPQHKTPPPHTPHRDNLCTMTYLEYLAPDVFTAM
jgi:hypothetical protein